MRHTPAAPLDDVRARGAEEARSVRDRIADGRFRRVSLTADRPGAVVEIEAPDLDAARAAMAGLPLVRDGLVTVEHLPVGPYRNLEALFA
jgi:hypothetical protein